MLTIKKDKCIPEKRKLGENISPNYICLKNGNKHFLSKEEKKDYMYGGKCPVFCPIKNVKSSCPNVSSVLDTTVARQQCEADTNCNFIGNQIFDRMGPNYCVPKSQPGCVTLTESDLVKSDKVLTDGHEYCDRLNKGCIFNRGSGDGLYERKGEVKCIRGCLGSKYWKNPKFMWGGGDTTQDPFDGSWFNSDLKVGPKYLEAAPSKAKPNGWGGPKGSPWFGNGMLPKSLGVPYTESKGDYSPPCNLNEGDVGVFTSEGSGQNLAGPGCKLTPPMPRFGMIDWSYTCGCPYLGGSGEFKPDAWEPCSDWELDQENISKRDVCEGCVISDDKNSKMFGNCVLGKKTKDTESELLGCVPDKSDPMKCRINRDIEPTECPEFCSNDVSNPYGWRKNTQCSEQLSKKFWKPNPEYKNIINLSTADLHKQAPMYIKNKGNYVSKNTDDLCRNCTQTSMQSGGSGTRFPTYSRCVVGGNETAGAFKDTGFGNYLARKMSCPATCRNCMKGFFGEPLEAQYDLKEATNPSSVFNKGIIFTPANIQKQAISGLSI